MAVAVRRGAPLAWLRSGRASVLVALLALATALRLPYLRAPLSSDEGGFLLVAHQWGTTSGSLYGNQWVDRPPGLLLVFRAADLGAALVGDRVSLRLVALLLALVAVAAAWVAGGVVAGDRGALAAAVVMVAITSTPMVSGPRLATALPAVTLVAVSVACTLVATYRSTYRLRPFLWAFAAGLAGALAISMKQNFADGLVFATVLWVLSGRRGRRLWAAFAVGAVVVAALLLAWAATGPGVGAAWEALFGFRGQAVSVIADHSTAAPERRFFLFVVVLLATGIVLLVGTAVWAVLRERPHAVAFAVAAALAYAAFGIAGGGSWWRHYALQLAVPLALGAALAVRAGLLRTVRVTVALTLASTLVAVVWQAPGALAGRPTSATAVGAWIAERAQPGDTGFVAYGSPQVLQVAGIEATYPYSWSLPLRVRDPDLARLTALLDGQQAPEWLVEMGSFAWWGIDTSAFDDAVARHYREVADVCGHRVFLHVGVDRRLGDTGGCPELYGRTTPTP